MLGGGATLAWALQLALTGAAASLVGAMWWNKRISFEPKAAALAAAVPMAPPYVYLYDLSVLGVSAAFLIRSALASGFIAGEVTGLAAIAALLLIMPFFNVPVGLITSAILGLLILRRVVLDRATPGLLVLSVAPSDAQIRV